MRVDIIPIGNSKGIRIPKAILDQCGFGESVEIGVKGDHIILRRIVRVREGWDEAFKAMAANADDKLLDMPSSAFDESEWEW